MICLFSSLALATPVNDKITAFNALSYFDVPTLSASQISDLEQHKVVKIMDSGDGVSQPKRGIGYLLTSATPKDLWISYSDSHFTLNTNFHYIKLHDKPPNKQVWYGLVDLPWPFEDRHWVTTSWNNLRLAEQSQNSMWEHPWIKSPEYHDTARETLAAGQYSKTVKDYDAAIFLPENSGAVATIQIESQTLLIYHATGTIGGFIPDDLMLRYLLHNLSDLMSGIEKRALENVQGHYTDGHKPVIDGGGQAIPLY